ncbi:MAG: hypothetical protein JW395_2017 [Nitrospira sp.]|nr:hypothetical protein [Nitrospira sp.]
MLLQLHFVLGEAIQLVVETGNLRLNRRQGRDVPLRLFGQTALILTPKLCQFLIRFLDVRFGLGQLITEKVLEEVLLGSLRVLILVNETGDQFVNGVLRLKAV